MAAASTPLALDLALVTAALLGFRHGFDHDHLAAITDIASVQREPRSAMRLGLLYALGHALTVALLGGLIIVFQRSLPDATDAWMERAVGATLLVLGFYVLWTSLFRPHTHARSRAMLLVQAFYWFRTKLRPRMERPAAAAENGGLGRAPALLIGVIHGVGAETPTQVLVFLLAANLGGIGKGLLGLAAFIIGMLAMNTLMCAVAAGLIRGSSGRPLLFRWVSGLTAAYSIGLGAFFLLGPSAVMAAVGS
jgi:high-affinity nickel-transport protein